MKPYAIISTDWHISSENVELSKSLAAQQIGLAMKMGVKRLICLGDVFESRKAQPEIVLKCFNDILDMINDSDMFLEVIPGNHDKTDYKSESSFLIPFASHPAIVLRDKPFSHKLVGEDIHVHFVPFYHEELWIPIVEGIDASAPGKHYLFSHQAMNGSRNNDGSKVESRINAQFLSKFDMCYFGHYHDEQQPLPNAIHLSAWKQKNFGEDDNKGFYILNLDKEKGFEFEKVPSDFPKFHTFELTTENAVESMSSLIELKQNGNVNVRVKVKGTTSEIKSLPLTMLTDSGIKVQTIDIEEVDTKSENATIQDYAKSEMLVDAFKEFCKEKDFDYEEGIKYLKNVL